MFTQQQNKSAAARLLAALAIVISIVAGCKDPVTIEEADVLLSIPKPELPYTAGTQFIYVTAGDAWTIDVDYLGKDGGWLRTDKESGSGSASGITLGWDENSGDESRYCEVNLKSGKRQSTVRITQLAYSAPNLDGPMLPTELKADPVPGWLELPAVDDPNLYYFNHSMNVGGKDVRNYSFYLDPKALVSVWVAYPLNKGLIGSGSRTNAWGLDPKVPRACQPVILGGFRTENWQPGMEGFQRGHQIPSADRYARGANEATFYGTNMTPQRGELNEKAWASLEGMVRSWAAQFDTLYVVTGADIKGSKEYALDNDGKKVTVPVGYFKALLGYKKSGTLGITGTTGGFTATAFYFEHKFYSDNAILGQSMTIDELEARLGYDFFPNLEAKIGKALADKVESTKDTWWRQ